MKLIIDIPEQMYLNAKADMLSGSDILVKAIKNGTPHETVTEFADRCRECGRERVLDKIRAEIEQIRLHKAQFLTNDNRVCIDSQEVLDVIDKYRGLRNE